MGIENKIPFAIKQDSGEMVSVDEVPSGLGCGCKCPSCDGRLVARKGLKNAHHFGHHDKSQEGCQYAFETSVRLMLLARLDEVVLFTTPARMVRFEGKLHNVSASHRNIKVTRVTQSHRHMAPTATYILQDKPDYGLGLYLPAVNEPRDPLPEWLEAHSREYPKTGILVVNYLAFAAHIFSDQRPAGMDTTTWLLNILSMKPECLCWMYHPADERVLAEQQARSDERQKQDLHRVASLLVRRRDAAKTQSSQKPGFLRYCACCYQQAAELSPEGYCFRETCISRRHSYIKRAPVTVGALRQVFKKDPPSTPKPMINEFGERLCVHCGVPMYRMASSWWCEECGQSLVAESGNN